MSFWGIEVKPGKPVTHSFDRTRRRLRVSQATLGIGNRTATSYLQCNVGNNTPVFLCALLPKNIECCHLDLEFEEVDDVIFSVLGPRSIHLSGYYIGKCSNAHSISDTESYGIDIGNKDTSSDKDSEDEYGGSFIDDDDEPMDISISCEGTNKGDNKFFTKKPKVLQYEKDIHSPKCQDESRNPLGSVQNEILAKTDDKNEHECKVKECYPLDEFKNEIMECIKNSKEENRVVDMSNIMKDQHVSNVEDEVLVPEFDSRIGKVASSTESDDARCIVLGLSSLRSGYGDDKPEQLTPTEHVQNVVSDMNIGNHSLKLPAENGRKFKKRKKENQGEAPKECDNSCLGDAQCDSLDTPVGKQDENDQKLKKQKEISEEEKYVECQKYDRWDPIVEAKQGVESGDMGKDVLEKTNIKSFDVNYSNVTDDPYEKKPKKKKKKKSKGKEEGTNGMPHTDEGKEDVIEQQIMQIVEAVNMDVSSPQTTQALLTHTDAGDGMEAGKKKKKKKVKVGDDGGNSRAELHEIMSKFEDKSLNRETS